MVGGSVGDPYGYVASASDIDLLVFTENRQHVTGELTADWVTGHVQSREVQGSNRAIESLTGVDERWDANVLFILSSAEDIRKDLQELQVDVQTHIPKLDKYLSYFAESEACKDRVGLYDYGRKVVVAVFTDQREFLAEKTLRSVNHQMQRIQDDRDLTSKGEKIDLRSYNDRVIDVVNALTYVLCCARNLPRSYEAIVYRRNNVLWEVLGIDQRRVKACISVQEPLEDSFAALRQLVSDVLQESRKWKPDFGLGSDGPPRDSARDMP